MDLREALFYIGGLIQEKERKAADELYQFKLLILAVHGDPQQLLEDLEQMEGQVLPIDADDEIGDQARLQLMSSARSKTWEENKAQNIG